MAGSSGRAAIVPREAPPIAFSLAALDSLLLAARNRPIVPARTATPCQTHRCAHDRRLWTNSPKRPTPLAARRNPETDGRRWHATARNCTRRASGSAGVNCRRNDTLRKSLPFGGGYSGASIAYKIAPGSAINASSWLAQVERERGQFGDELRPRSRATGVNRRATKGYQVEGSVRLPTTRR